MDIQEIRERLNRLAAEYPEDLRDEQRSDVPRIAFNIHLALSGRDPRRLTICDVGGGIGLFSPGCAAVGFKEVTLVDDFRDRVNEEVGDSIFAIHEKHGVRVVSRDVIAEGLGDVSQRAFDVYTTFDSMEHWHNSPKKMFGELIASLKPGGTLVIGVPNCVNLRKRISVPLGFGKWSSMDDWYESETFRAHVREPDLDDLRYIAEDLGLVNVKFHGRNWMGRISPSSLVRTMTRLIDRPLRVFPSLCSDLYLVGSKPG